MDFKVFIVFLTLSISSINCLNFTTSSNIEVNVNASATTPYLDILKDGSIIQTILIDTESNAVVANSGDNITVTGTSRVLTISLTYTSTNFTLLHFSRESITNATILQDCLNLKRTTTTYWYGGPQQKYQYWPVDQLNLTDYSYVTKELDNCGIAERYWLSSDGVFIYLDAETPLFIDQNVAHANHICFRAKNVLPYDIYSSTFSFKYHIGIGLDARSAHREAVTRFLNKPTGHPADSMVRNPIWSTWARYKRDINESTVLEFANEIVANNFTGQYELDDDWETCYGSLTFNTAKFPAIKNLTDNLKTMGFKVTLWIHPFVNVNCTEWYANVTSLGYFVKAQNTNSTLTQWWNSVSLDASYIDFTQTAAATWFTNRLTALQTSAGIDSYKFDAGESSWSPTDPIQNGTAAMRPSVITSTYIRTVSAFGSLVEVRSGQNTQDLPIFVRMIDKDSLWTWNNGLPTLITTLLQLNMVGYPLVLPDMIGGNGYDGKPAKELFIRWLQANVFMPSLQYSYVPWDYDNETTVIAQKFTALHEQYTDVIMARFALAVSSGEPVNPPLWWISPSDTTALGISDQFLLGEDIIAAPVIVENATMRDVYLPTGTWQDGNSASVYTGPVWVYNYSAPLDTLPYFVRYNSSTNGTTTNTTTTTTTTTTTVATTTTTKDPNSGSMNKFVVWLLVVPFLITIFVQNF